MTVATTPLRVVRGIRRRVNDRFLLGGCVVTRAKWLMFVAGASATALLWGTPASAVVNPTPVPPAPRANTEMTFTSLGPGHGVVGFIADASNPFDPLTGYPPVNPPSGFTPLNEGFAGVIIGTPADGTAPLSLYCIDIRTETRPGFGYELGSWSEASVPRVGYVARILNSYYPAVPRCPRSAPTPTRRQAVQAAIWYFSDRYVLNTTDPLHNAVASIAADGDRCRPTAATSRSNTDDHTLDPQRTCRHQRRTVRGDIERSTTVAGVGGDMFADAGATVPVSNGRVGRFRLEYLAEVEWDRGGCRGALGDRTATVPTGNVYLYDGNIGGVSTAQKLILAESATLRTTVSANAVFEPPGSLVVTKTIAGPAAGTQGQVVIVVTVQRNRCSASVRDPCRCAARDNVANLRPVTRWFCLHGRGGG